MEENKKSLIDQSDQKSYEINFSDISKSKIENIDENSLNLESEDLLITIEDIKKSKIRGDNSFKSKLYKSAIKEYSYTIKQITKKFEEFYSDENENKATDLIETYGVPTYSNLSKCYFKENDFKNAVNITSKIINLQPNNVKANYLRYKSYLELNDLDNAGKDLNTLREILNDSEELKELEAAFEEKNNTIKLKEMKVFKKMIKARINNEKEEKAEIDEPHAYLSNAVYFLLSQLYLIILYAYYVAKNFIANIVKKCTVWALGFAKFIKDLILDHIRFKISIIKVIVTFPFSFAHKLYSEFKEVIFKFKKKQANSEKINVDNKNEKISKEFKQE